MSRPSFVPADFVVPGVPRSPHFRLEPLGPEHNERDYAAWNSSFDHIHATPGFAGRDWPHEMPLEENLSDLVKHAADFEAHTGFTYSVLRDDEVIGCLYIYPARASDDPTVDADVRSWVTAEHANLDRELWSVVSAWLQAKWPFASPSYAAR